VALIPKSIRVNFKKNIYIFNLEESNIKIFIYLFTLVKYIFFYYFFVNFFIFKKKKTKFKELIIFNLKLKFRILLKLVCR
jgi:hypothetical protein